MPLIPPEDGPGSRFPPRPPKRPSANPYVPRHRKLDPSSLRRAVSTSCPATPDTILRRMHDTIMLEQGRGLPFLQPGTGTLFWSKRNRPGFLAFEAVGYDEAIVLVELLHEVRAVILNQPYVGDTPHDALYPLLPADLVQPEHVVFPQIELARFFLGTSAAVLGDVAGGRFSAGRRFPPDRSASQVSSADD